MLGKDLWEIQQQAMEEKAQNQEKQEEKVAKKREEEAKKKIKEIREELEAKAHSGEILMIELGTAYFKYDEICYQKTRELGWDVGINVCKRTNSRGENYYAIINSFYNGVSLYNFFNNSCTVTTAIEETYIRLEQQYFNEISDDNDVPKICTFIETSTNSNQLRKISILALLNAAYRKGIEGEFGCDLGMQKIRPTYSEVIDSEKIEGDYYENYIQIMHKSYLEQTDKDNQKEGKPPQKAKNTKTG